MVVPIPLIINSLLFISNCFRSLNKSATVILASISIRGSRVDFKVFVIIRKDSFIKTSILLVRELLKNKTATEKTEVRSLIDDNQFELASQSLYQIYSSFQFQSETSMAIVYLERSYVTLQMFRALCIF